MKLIIGVAGVSGSGKSTIADYIQTRGAAVVSLADPLKEMMLPLGFSHEQLWGTSSKRSEALPGTTLTCRRALEVVGDALINEHRRLFVDIAIRCAKESPAPIVVIPDVRYFRTVPEVQAIQAAGGKLVKRSTTEPATNTHRSNVEHLDMPDWAFDAVLPQYATLAELYAAVDELIERWTAIGFVSPVIEECEE